MERFRQWFFPSAFRHSIRTHNAEASRSSPESEFMGSEAPYPAHDPAHERTRPFDVAVLERGNHYDIDPRHRRLKISLTRNHPRWIYEIFVVMFAENFNIVKVIDIDSSPNENISIHQAKAQEQLGEFISIDLSALPYRIHHLAIVAFHRDEYAMEQLTGPLTMKVAAERYNMEDIDVCRYDHIEEPTRWSVITQITRQAEFWRLTAVGAELDSRTPDIMLMNTDCLRDCVSESPTVRRVVFKVDGADGIEARENTGVYFKTNYDQELIQISEVRNNTNSPNWNDSERMDLGLVTGADYRLLETKVYEKSIDGEFCLGQIRFLAYMAYRLMPGVHDLFLSLDDARDENRMVLNARVKLRVTIEVEEFELNLRRFN